MFCTNNLCIVLGFFLAGCGNANDTAPEHPTPVSGAAFVTAEILNDEIDPDSLRVIYVRSGRDGNLWHYLTPSGKAVLGLRAYSCEPFHDGLAKVGTSDTQNHGIRNYGFVNSHGEMVINPTFDHAQSFQEGRAVVGRNERYGFIDAQGKIVVPLEYEVCGSFRGGIGWGQQGDKKVFFDTDGNVLFEMPEGEAAGRFSEGLLFVSRDTTPKAPPGRTKPAGTIQRGYVDKTGKFAFTTDSSVLHGGEFHEGLAVVSLAGRPQPSYSYINKDGKQAFPAEFQGAEDFSDGMALVRSNVDGKRVCGYIDKSGKLVIKPQFHQGGPFSEGLAAVFVREEDLPGQDRRDRKSETDESRSHRQQGDSGNIPEDLHPDIAPAGKWGYIDTTGKFIISPVFDSADVFHHGLARVRREKHYGFIDKNGAWVWRGTQIELR